MVMMMNFWFVVGIDEGWRVGYWMFWSCVGV